MTSVNVKKILLFEARDKLRTEENNYEFAQVLEFLENRISFLAFQFQVLNFCFFCFKTKENLLPF
ncbi:hypothetical protein EG340_09365 [Chryseobacterium indoltheticum]|uniref:Uncharacterized protein n=1 Tax=Chryseobacterium indoltheticum TaxID=254 RepID=A0A3G6N8I3_9FLAO|nr:hypothetical protein EG340_09365 [Chryseobacterium indoltheticum]